MQTPKLTALLAEIRACTACMPDLPLGPRPILQAGVGARLVIVGQAPGTRVHTSGVPWDDASGVRLREWLGISSAVFYDAEKIALLPMGFCYPGRGAGGDLPPRPECASLWRTPLHAALPQVQLTLLVGQYAQAYYLKNAAAANTTETVRNFQHFLPAFLPLPHPSPRNNIWLKKNSWFAAEVLPVLRARMRVVLSNY